MTRSLLTAVSLLAFTFAAAAGPASDAVRFFYDPIHFEGDPEFRDRFVEPAKKVFDMNDAAAKNPENTPCIDFSPGLDAQDYDEGEIAKSLTLTETVTGDTADVTAKFNVLPDDPESVREMHWTLKQVAGVWKIADIQSITGEWRLSEFDCSEGGEN